MTFITATYHKKSRSVKCDIPITSDIALLMITMWNNANDKRMFLGNCEIEGINPMNYIVEDLPKTIQIKADVSYFELMIRVAPLIESINEKLALHLKKDFVEFWKQDYSLKIKAIPKAAKPKKKYFLESIDKDGLTPIYWASGDGWVSASDGIDKTLYGAEKTAKKVIYTDPGKEVKVSSVIV